MRVVLDTNVFASRIFFSGPPAEILVAWQAGKLELLYSVAILDEYRRVIDVLSKEHGVKAGKRVLSVFERKATMCQISVRKLPICRDPDDDKFLLCAMQGRAKYLVSGDRDLLAVRLKAIKVISPRVFVDRHLRRL